MKYDVYYARKHDRMYDNITECLSEGVCADKSLNLLTRDKLFDLMFDYNQTCIICESEDELVDALFGMHTRDDYTITRECQNIILAIHPHLDEDTLAFNLRTHELRRVRYVEIDTVHLYNTDDCKSSAQKYGYVSIIDECWDRKEVIPFHPESSNYKFGNFHFGSALGVHPKYGKIAFHDLCDF